MAGSRATAPDRHQFAQGAFLALGPGHAFGVADEDGQGDGDGQRDRGERHQRLAPACRFDGPGQRRRAGEVAKRPKPHRRPGQRAEHRGGIDARVDVVGCHQARARSRPDRDHGDVDGHGPMGRGKDQRPASTPMRAATTPCSASNAVKRGTHREAACGEGRPQPRRHRQIAGRRADFGASAPASARQGTSGRTG